MKIEFKLEIRKSNPNPFSATKEIAKVIEFSFSVSSLPICRIHVSGAENQTKTGTHK
jgi:hypothetical protein